MKEKVGILITTFNDYKEFSEMVIQLSECDDVFQENVVVVDGSTQDEQKELIKEACATLGFRVLSWCKHLTQALNVGTLTLIGKKHNCDYVLWVHTDMRFDQHKDWITNLVNFAKENPNVGKCAPRNYNLENADAPDSPGNTCPTLLKKEIIEAVFDKYGELYDENYYGACCWDDDDLNRKIYSVHKEVWITGKSRVWHKGMGTRGNFERGEWEAHNALYHFKKWGENKMFV